jgi:hypothetical protein
MTNAARLVALNSTTLIANLSVAMGSLKPARDVMEIFPPLVSRMMNALRPFFTVLPPPAMLSVFKRRLFFVCPTMVAVRPIAMKPLTLIVIRSAAMEWLKVVRDVTAIVQRSVSPLTNAVLEFFKVRLPRATFSACKNLSLVAFPTTVAAPLDATKSMTTTAWPFVETKS